MIKTKSYLTQSSMDRGIKDMNIQGFRALHISFIQNDRNLGYVVEFDDTVLTLIPVEMTTGEFIDDMMKRANIIHKPSTLTRFRTLLRLN